MVRPKWPEIASRRLGRPVETLLFDELDEHDAYDGVWASACLLARAPGRTSLPSSDESAER